MEKIVIDTECLNQNNTAQGSNATFVVKAEKQPAANPNQPARLSVTRAASFNFSDGTGRNIEAGKKYRLTIEEIE